MYSSCFCNLHITEEFSKPSRTDEKNLINENRQNIEVFADLHKNCFTSKWIPFDISAQTYKYCRKINFDNDSNAYA